MPYTNLYAHDDDPRNQPGDLDGDGIPNKTDVCIEDSYKQDYHENCLEKFGFRLDINEPNIDDPNVQKVLEQRGVVIHDTPAT